MDLPGWRDDGFAPGKRNLTIWVVASGPDPAVLLAYREYNSTISASLISAPN
jgi:hypothetical protein